jgi:hypothetical protein
MFNAPAAALGGAPVIDGGGGIMIVGSGAYGGIGSMYGCSW